MTIAYTCVLIAILLPYLLSYYMKQDHFRARDYDNNAPREQLARLEGSRKRALWACENSFEGLPGFIAAVIIAHLAGASQGVIDTLAVIYVLARIVYIVCYVTDRATARSAVWSIGFFAMIGLFVAAF